MQRATFWYDNALTKVSDTQLLISRYRRLSKDFERHARKAAAFIRLAMIRLMLRRLTAPSS